MHRTANHKRGGNTSRKQSGTGNTTPGKPKKAHRHHRRQVNQVDINEEFDSSLNDGYIFAVTSGKQWPHANIKVCDVPVQLMVDSGADVNILDTATYDRLSHLAPLKPTSVKIYPFGTDKELPVKREIRAAAESQHKITVATFYISRVGNRSLLSYNTARELKLIKMTLSAVSTEPASCMNAHKIYKEYPDLFMGVGKLKNCQVKLHIDKSVQLIAQPHRCVPFHLCKKLGPGTCRHHQES